LLVKSAHDLKRRLQVSVAGHQDAHVVFVSNTYQSEVERQSDIDALLLGPRTPSRTVRPAWRIGQWARGQFDQR
jgi:hypothetical protein